MWHQRLNIRKAKVAAHVSGDKGLTFEREALQDGFRKKRSDLIIKQKRVCATHTISEGQLQTNLVYR